jgi:hypothetical protein
MNELVVTHLRNGDEVPAVVVTTTMLSLQKLLAEQPIAFFELVEVCRDPLHKLFGNTGSTLYYSYGLATSPAGDIHEMVRSIVLSAVTGDGFNLSLGSPLPESE